MAPKKKGGFNQAASAAGKPFDEDAKADILKEMTARYGGDVCHHTLFYAQRKEDT